MRPLSHNEQLELLRLIQQIATGIRPRQDAQWQDLVSAGSLAAAFALHRYDASRGTPLGAYLHPRIRGAMVDHLRREYGRRRRRCRFHSLDAYRAVCGELPAPHRRPGAEERESFESRITRLQPRQRAMLRLRFIADLTYREIGAWLGITEQAASQYVHRTLATMKGRKRQP
jgi:RNA polymerase sigma factor (sigma-70 family)